LGLTPILNIERNRAELSALSQGHALTDELNILGRALHSNQLVQLIELMTLSEIGGVEVAYSTNELSLASEFYSVA